MTWSEASAHATKGTVIQKFWKNSLIRRKNLPTQVVLSTMTSLDLQKRNYMTSLDMISHASWMVEFNQGKLQLSLLVDGDTMSRKSLKTRQRFCSQPETFGEGLLLLVEFQTTLWDIISLDLLEDLDFKWSNTIMSMLLRRSWSQTKISLLTWQNQFRDKKA